MTKIHESVARILEKQNETAKSEKRAASTKRGKSGSTGNAPMLDLEKSLSFLLKSLDEHKLEEWLRAYDKTAQEERVKNVAISILSTLIARGQPAKVIKAFAKPMMKGLDYQIPMLMAAAYGRKAELSALIAEEPEGARKWRDLIFLTAAQGVVDDPYQTIILSKSGGAVKSMLMTTDGARGGQRGDREGCLRMLAKEGIGPKDDEEWRECAKGLLRAGRKIFPETRTRIPLETLFELGMDPKMKGMGELVMCESQDLSSKKALEEMRLFAEKGVNFGTTQCFKRAWNKEMREFCVNAGVRLDELMEYLLTLPSFEDKAWMREGNDFAKREYVKNPTILLKECERPFVGVGNGGKSGKGSLATMLLSTGYMNSGWPNVKSDSKELDEALAACAKSSGAQEVSNGVLTYGDSVSVKRAMGLGFPAPDRETVMRELERMDGSKLTSLLIWGVLNKDDCTMILNEIASPERVDTSSARLRSLRFNVEDVCKKLVEQGAETVGSDGRDLLTRVLISAGNMLSHTDKNEKIKVAVGMAIGGASMSGEGIKESVLTEFSVALNKEIKSIAQREKMAASKVAAANKKRSAPKP